MQLGLLATCGGTAIIAAVCLLGLFPGILALGLTSNPSTNPSTTLPSSSAQMDDTVSAYAETALLSGELEVIRRQIEILKVNRDLANANAEVPLPIPNAFAEENGVNLRTGPGTNYTKIGVLAYQDEAEIIGRNVDGTWWLVAVPGGVAWVADEVLTVNNVSDAVPIITIPSLLVLPEQSLIVAARQPTPVVSPTPRPPVGTPTPGPEVERAFVQASHGYQALSEQLMLSPISESYSPDGARIAITERIKVYTVAEDGSSGMIWFEDDDNRGPIGGVVWSPNGEYLAFVVGFKQKEYCLPCQAVAVVNVTDETLFYLEAPEENWATETPRWLQDGRLMVNAHIEDSANGIPYIYDIDSYDPKETGTPVCFPRIEEEGGGEVCFNTVSPSKKATDTTVYTFSASHEGQKSFPWQPGRTWGYDKTERPDSYNSDDFGE
ncbi:MAG: SH3 domain-containing protein [Chloroflexota bacterium]